MEGISAKASAHSSTIARRLAACGFSLGLLLGGGSGVSGIAATGTLGSIGPSLVIGGSAALAVLAAPGLAPVPASAAESDFVFPRSSYELLTNADLAGLSAHDLYLARNEIFARHGYIFVLDDLRSRFSSVSWYVPLYTEAQFSWSLLNEVEQANIALIQKRELTLAGKMSSADEPGSYLFPQSSSTLLTDADLSQCTAHELYLARNEIFARHGYIFSGSDLQEYFGGKSWYTPRYTPEEFRWDWLSSVEMKNIALIQEREDLLATAPTSASVTVMTGGRVETPYFAFDIPGYWQGFVDVIYETDMAGYPSVGIVYRGEPDLRLMTVRVCDASLDINAGDIGNGLVSWWDNSRGQRVELRATNFVFRTQYAASAGSASASYPSDLVEAALIDLSTGGAYTVESARNAAVRQGSGTADGYDYYRATVAPTIALK